jgi:hypothetical protein
LARLGAAGQAHRQLGGGKRRWRFRWLRAKAPRWRRSAGFAAAPTPKPLQGGRATCVSQLGQADVIKIDEHALDSRGVHGNPIDGGVGLTDNRRTRSARSGCPVLIGARERGEAVAGLSGLLPDLDAGVLP